MVNVVIDVAKVVVAVGVATGIIVLATKADAEGAKEILGKAAGNAGHYRTDGYKSGGHKTYSHKSTAYKSNGYHKADKNRSNKYTSAENRSIGFKTRETAFAV